MIYILNDKRKKCKINRVRFRVLGQVMITTIRCITMMLI
jgi:hypothetical protein